MLWKKKKLDKYYEILKVLRDNDISSEIYLVENETSRRVLIEMNAPLRHKGYTLYQASFAELDNGKTLLYKYTDLYKRVDVRNFKSIRVYGDKGTIISDCLLDSDTPEMFSIIWEDGKTHHLSINTIYSSDSDLQEAIRQSLGS